MLNMVETVTFYGKKAAGRKVVKRISEKQCKYAKVTGTGVMNTDTTKDLGHYRFIALKEFVGKYSSMDNRYILWYCDGTNT